MLHKSTENTMKTSEISHFFPTFKKRNLWPRAVYLDEFTFRFNRRKSASRGKLFYRLVEHAVALEPQPYHRLRGGKSRLTPPVVAT